MFPSLSALLKRQERRVLIADPRFGSPANHRFTCSANRRHAAGVTWSIGPSAALLGVTDEHAASLVGYLHAVTTAVPAVAGLPPTRIYVVFHCSAASKMRVRLAARGSASAWIRTKLFTALRTRYAAMWHALPRSAAGPP
jgi:hypothetical protein